MLKAMVVAMAEKAALLEERNLHFELVNKSASVRNLSERLPKRALSSAERGAVCSRLRGDRNRRGGHRSADGQICGRLES
ncbi:hypothetical protein MPL3356_340183 [Mesorhizobium plurifarium]|uniref:Uncharacterized protein n=1 Tax=Mesorhizobium plurifarium TaxID=69974 RepID=A0A090E2R9_MESPL|nr:hypothetical protein MPL3356_340183 [Mesorhizobium plurifarium]